jgi:hypothetical protein
MERLLALREREGLTYAEAAQRGRVSRGTLAWWSWRLRHEGAESAKCDGGFVEVEILQDSPTGDSGLEVVVGAHVVRVARDFDEPTLRRLLGALSC